MNRILAHINLFALSADIVNCDNTGIKANRLGFLYFVEDLPKSCYPMTIIPSYLCCLFL